ncbi:10573_t:CDS:2, partial [Scutellospora calospora]
IVEWAFGKRMTPAEPGEPGKEARTGDQEERKEWSDGCGQGASEGSANDAEHEGCDKAPGKHEQTDEPARPAAHCNGEMMDDAIDDVTGLEDEEEGEEVVNQVLDEIGVDLGQSLGETPQGLQSQKVQEGKVAQAVGGGGGAADAGDDDLQARLDSLRR